jgi:hypothetical protein
MEPGIWRRASKPPPGPPLGRPGSDPEVIIGLVHLVLVLLAVGLVAVLKWTSG